MFPSLARLALPLVLLVGLSATAEAQESLRGREMKRRRVSLTVSTADKPVELHVASDYLTALEFDSPVDRDAVMAGGAGSRFALFEVTARAIFLKPAMDLGPGRSVELTVTFADGAAPARVVFSLVTHPAEVDAQVMVSRLPRAAEAIQAELDEVRVACAAKDAELEALRARSVASGPAGMIFAGLLDKLGVKAGEPERLLSQGRGDVVSRDVVTYRASGWGAVALRVRNTGAQPWRPVEARLSVVASGERVNVLAVRMREPRIEPGEVALVVVETGAPNWSEGAALRLELRDNEGGRSLLIPRISF
ncbi:DUF2381 family protein [Myxococcus llanfairpwllgwyngyllgogerychwyrndrobwllllantysiliogogogochensis]|uniref:DUF2381 family protein n=1 Tax=Myxococcus TaxID=32 RepID=UPI00157A6A46|nr:DUF2381 family protein [Myxococcus llanfairpwllgwyngyllgogerychwyrndrobwllllantysiliogogogochensis]